MLLKFKSYDNIVNVSIWRNTQVWLKGSVLKTDRSVKARRGSNPLSSSIFIIAGWSSLAARWAHNPKVASSSLASATKCLCLKSLINQAFFIIPFFSNINLTVTIFL